MTRPISFATAQEPGCNPPDALDALIHAIADLSLSPSQHRDLQRLQSPVQTTWTYLLSSLCIAEGLLLESHPTVGICQALEQVRQILGLRSLYICEHYWDPAQEQILFTLQFETLAPREPSRLDQPEWQEQAYAAPGWDRLYAALAQGKIIDGQQLQHFHPELCSPERWPGERSHLLIPLPVSDQLWGFLGAERSAPGLTPTPWTDEQTWMLCRFARLLCAALQRHQIEQQLSYQAFQDPLTGLPNRLLFNNNLPVAIAHAKRSHELLAIVFLDLDRFKHVNDQRGHAVGDVLLVEVVSRLHHCLREEDTLARWGGDEFTLCLPNLRSNEDAAKVCERILEVLRPPFFIDGHELTISGSMGIALFPQDGEDGDTLLRNADAALYRVKDQGRDHYQFYRPEMNSQALQRLAREQRLRRAVEREEFVLYYQPRWRVVDRVDNGHGPEYGPEHGPEYGPEYGPEHGPEHGPDGRGPGMHCDRPVSLGREGTLLELSALEVLIRWANPQEGLLLPDQFLDLLEVTGLSQTLGDWVLVQALAQAQSWQAQGLNPPTLALNVTMRQIQPEGWVANLEQLLRVPGNVGDGPSLLPPAQISLEISYLALTKDPHRIQAVIRDCRGLGVGVALEDFGSPGACWHELHQIAVSQLKLEQKFVASLERETEALNSPPPPLEPLAADGPNPSFSRAFAAMLHTLTQQLGLSLVAEGIETLGQWQVLRSLGYREFQGNWLSPPLSREEAEELLRGTVNCEVDISRN